MYRLLFVFLWLPLPAWAAIGSIANIEVNEGAANAQWRNSYSSDEHQPGIDARWRSRLGVDYGFTDEYAAGFFVQLDDQQGVAPELEAMLIDQRVEIHTLKEHGFYSGFRVRYTWRDGDKKPDEAHVRLILGIEGFHFFGSTAEMKGFKQQSHEIGPVLIGQLGDGLSYDVSYRQGISHNAADHVLRFVLYKAF